MIHLLVRYRCEVVVIHAHVILCREEILESPSVYSRVALSGVDMSEKLPDVLIAPFKAQERIVAEIDPLLAHHDVHLHCHMLKATDKALAQVLQVVIAHYQIDSAIKAVEHFGPLSSTTQAEVAQVKYCVIGPDYPVPIRYQRFIHLLHVLKRSVTELDDVRMVEMGVGREERMATLRTCPLPKEQHGNRRWATTTSLPYTI